jgi:7,8-dihydro-6-hydroxymethylpterin-pyrophosphokinase
LNQVLEVPLQTPPKYCFKKLNLSKKNLEEPEIYYDSDTGKMIYSDRTIDIDILLTEMKVSAVKAYILIPELSKGICASSPDRTL